MSRTGRTREESESYFWYQENQLGRGATGFVYKCQHKKTGQEFAAKVFNAQGMRRDNYVTKRELNLLEKLKDCTHENIVKVIALEKEKKYEAHAIIMEYCQGGSLHNMLEMPENNFGFEESNFKQVVYDVVSGMKYLNDQGVIHRDIKPGNILRYIKDDGGCVYKLTDFGTARELAPEQEFTSIYGTEEYLHPDVYERGLINKLANKKFTANVDLWSLGVTFYHVATGKLPFRAYEGRNNRLTMHEIISQRSPGIISGNQREANGPIEWSDKLPEHTRLSQGLKEHVVKILADLLEPGMRFDDLFQAIERIKAMKMIHVYSAQSGTFHIIYANPEDNFARFQELVAIQTGVSARQQDLFYNNDTFKPTGNASTYPDTTETKPILVLGGDSIPSEKVSGQLEVKKPILHKSTSLESLDSDAVISKMFAVNVYFCLQNAKRLDLSKMLTLEAAENVITLFKRKARKYLDDAKAIENHCDSIVMKHQACINGCNFEKEVLELLGTDDDIPKEIVAELDHLVKETEAFNTNVDKLQKERSAPMEKLRTNAHALLTDGELAKKWKDMSADEDSTNYVAMIQTYTQKVEEIMESFRRRVLIREKCSTQDLEDHKFERLRLEEYFTKSKEAMEACHTRRQKLHENLRSWLEDAYTYRSNLKKMQKEVKTFVDMFSVLAESEEEWRANHMTKMKEILSKVRTQVRRAISVQSTASDQQHSAEDATDGRNVATLGTDFIEDINRQLYQLSSETKEAKLQLEKGNETFQKFVEELIDGLNKKSVELENAGQ